MRTVIIVNGVADTQITMVAVSLRVLGTRRCLTWDSQAEVGAPGSPENSAPAARSPSALCSGGGAAE
jgi:hypothetical protein